MSDEATAGLDQHIVLRANKQHLHHQQSGSSNVKPIVIDVTNVVEGNQLSLDLGVSTNGINLAFHRHVASLQRFVSTMPRLGSSVLTTYKSPVVNLRLI